MIDFKANDGDKNEIRGIVISCGVRTRLEPRFSAYVWSGTDDAERESDTKAA